jgi:hypothetical protein
LPYTGGTVSACNDTETNTSNWIAKKSNAQLLRGANQSKCLGNIHIHTCNCYITNWTIVHGVYHDSIHKTYERTILYTCRYTILVLCSIVKIEPAIKLSDSHERAGKHSVIEETVRLVTSVYYYWQILYQNMQKCIDYAMV